MELYQFYVLCATKMLGRLVTTNTRFPKLVFGFEARPKITAPEPASAADAVWTLALVAAPDIAAPLPVSEPAA